MDDMFRIGALDWVLKGKIVMFVCRMTKFYKVPVNSLLKDMKNGSKRFIWRLMRQEGNGARKRGHGFELWHYIGTDGISVKSRTHNKKSVCGAGYSPRAFARWQYSKEVSVEETSTRQNWLVQSEFQRGLKSGKGVSHTTDKAPCRWSIEVSK